MKELAQNVYKIIGLRMTSAQLEALQTYEEELMVWNTRYNLTAIKEPAEIRIKHFLDSLTALLVMREKPMQRVIDVGTGAGFPGLPLKIIYPGMELTLVESVGKKVEFCEHIVKTLALEGVQIIKARVENLAHQAEHRQVYDWAVARAVAAMPVLVEYLLPLVRIGGSVLAMKGESAAAEMQEAEYATQIMGGKLRMLQLIHLPGVTEDRYLVVIDKNAASPEKYPRRVGIPAKRPLSLKQKR